MNAAEVYFLGAGFSKGIKTGATGSRTMRLPFPVSADLLRHEYLKRKAFSPSSHSGLSWFRDRAQPLFKVLTNDFAAVYKDGAGWILDRQEDDESLADFETLYSHCMLESNNPILGLGEQQLYRDCIMQLQQYLQQVLDCKNYAMHRAALRLSDFLRTIHKHSVLFTTNFDNVIEQCYSKTLERTDRWVKNEGQPLEILESKIRPLHDIHSGLKYLAETNSEYFGKLEPYIANSTVFLFKLHGGIDYISCGNKHCTFYNTPRYFPGSRPMVDSCPNCGASTVIGIFPPTTLKDYNTNSYYSRLLRTLWDTISKCKRFIVIGYSFPELDTILTSTICSAVRKNPNCIVTVVDHQPDPIVRRLERMTGGKLAISALSSIESYIDKKLKEKENSSINDPFSTYRWN